MYNEDNMFKISIVASGGTLYVYDQPMSRKLKDEKCMLFTPD